MQQVVGVAILDGSRVLGALRPDRPGRPGGWEFPGGKVEPGESGAQAAVREIAEELGVTVVVTGWLDGAVAIDDRLELSVCLARIRDDDPPTPRSGEHEAVRWWPCAELDESDWLPADRPFVIRLREEQP